MARSGMPSLLKSPVAMALALKFGAMSGGVKKTWLALLAQRGCSPNMTAEIDSSRAREVSDRSADMDGPRWRVRLRCCHSATRDSTQSFADSARDTTYKDRKSTRLNSSHLVIS